MSHNGVYIYIDYNIPLHFIGYSWIKLGFTSQLYWIDLIILSSMRCLAINYF